MSHPADKMLPKERAHGHLVWCDTTPGIRKEFKRRHRKKCRSHGAKVMKEQMRESYRPSADTVS
jgi:hypothetical protein